LYLRQPRGEAENVDADPQVADDVALSFMGIPAIQYQIVSEPSETPLAARHDWR
jgi:hypothetical protein